MTVLTSGGGRRVVIRGTAAIAIKELEPHADGTPLCAVALYRERYVVRGTFDEITKALGWQEREKQVETELKVLRTRLAKIKALVGEERSSRGAFDVEGERFISDLVAALESDCPVEEPAA